MNNETILFSRRRLPHWEVYGKSYFVTFRLRGSLPREVILNLQKQRDILLSKDHNEKELLQFQREEFQEIERVLDSVNNEDNAFLTRDDTAPILMESFDFLEEKYCWRFSSFVIMPNHVHCLCLADKKGEQINLTGIFALLKKYTAREINKILNKRGRMWVDENFDHWCRTVDKEESIKKYIANNPVKAGLVQNSNEWKWMKK